MTLALILAMMPPLFVPCFFTPGSVVGSVFFLSLCIGKWKELGEDDIAAKCSFVGSSSKTSLTEFRQSAQTQRCENASINYKRSNESKAECSSVGFHILFSFFFFSCSQNWNFLFLIHFS